MYEKQIAFLIDKKNLKKGFIHFRFSAFQIEVFPLRVSPLKLRAQKIGVKRATEGQWSLKLRTIWKQVEGFEDGGFPDEEIDFDDPDIEHCDAVVYYKLGFSIWFNHISQ